MPLFGVADANDENSEPYLLIEADDRKDAIDIVRSKANTIDTFIEFYNQCFGNGAYGDLLQNEEEDYDSTSKQSREKYFQYIFRVIGPFQVIKRLSNSTD